MAPQLTVSGGYRQLSPFVKTSMVQEPVLFSALVILDFFFRGPSLPPWGAVIL